MQREQRQNQDDSGLLRRERAAEYLDMPVETLDQHFASGALPRVKIGRSVAYRRADLDTFMARHLEWGGK